MFAKFVREFSGAILEDMGMSKEDAKIVGGILGFGTMVATVDWSDVGDFIASLSSAEQVEALSLGSSR